jgi:threonylcarbamoyladenosine tRNA methylthiotransferase MtaB
LNQAETQLLQDKLVAHGYTIVPFGAAADLAIINTCTVTRLAEAKCRQSIRQFVADNAQAFVAVIGCYSQLGASEIATIPGVDLILGNRDKMSVLDYIGDGSKNPIPVVVRERIHGEDFSIEFLGDAPFNKRANLKVQDGCDCGCSFCIIPKARGTARSRDFDNTLAEARSLATRGVRELVLTGVNIGTYATRGQGITSLIDALADVPGIDRIRISSIEPATVPTALLDRMADAAHPLLPYLHLPLQSGCERILRDMRRHYSRAEYARFAQLAVSRVPDLFLGTDIMVGFPGETDDEFRDTCDFFQQMPFAFAHVFTYSERQGTSAARRADPVSIPTRQQRSAHLRRLAAARRHAFLSAHAGRTMRVLFEDFCAGAWPGYTDNYLRVVLPASQACGRHLANQVLDVHLAAVGADFLYGSLPLPEKA